MTSTPLNGAGNPTKPIEKRQLEPDMLLLQRAANGAHKTAQRIEETQILLALAFCIAGVLAASTGRGKEIVTVVGLLWSVVSIFLLTGLVNSRSKDAAVLQEQFDVAMFRLPWNQTLAGSRVQPAKVEAYARRTKPGSADDKRITKGWYDPVDGVPHPYDALICQDQNLAWDARLRRVYAACVLAVGVAWLLGAVVVAICVQTSVTRSMFAFVVPSLGAMQLGVATYRSQRAIADERERLGRTVTELLNIADPNGTTPSDEADLRGLVRGIQDGIFRTRGLAGRVPTIVYKARSKRDERDHARVSETYRNKLAGTHGGS